MSIVYSINHTDPTKASFTINPAQLDGQDGIFSNSSLTLHGAGRLKYGKAVNENFLRLLENFASEANILTPISISSADNSGTIGQHFIRIPGDYSNVFINDFTFDIVGSTIGTNDGVYTVNGDSTYSSITNLTTIILQESLPADVLQNLGGVLYDLIEPNPELVNKPYNEGQLWFNNTTNVLYIYKDVSGTGIFRWTGVGSIETSNVMPSTPNTGDFWYDLSENQLKIFENGQFESVANRYVLKTGDTMSGDLSFTLANATTSNKINFNTGHSDLTSIYKYEPATNVSHLRISLSDDPGGLVDLLDIGTTSANVWYSSLTINTAGDINTTGDFNTTGDILANDIDVSDIISNSITAGTTIYATGKITSANLMVSNVSIASINTNNKNLTTKEYVDSSISTYASGAGSDYLPLVGGTLTGDLVFALNNSTTSNKLRFNSAHNDPVAIYTYEPSNDVSHLRISLSDNSNSPVDILNIGADTSGGWYSSVTIDTSGNINTIGKVVASSTISEAGSLLQNKYLGINAKAADSNLLDGFDQSSSSVGNTISRRNSAGDITSRLFKSEYPTAGSVSASSAIAFRNNNTSDNYIRFVDKNGMLNFLGINGLGSYLKAANGYVSLGNGIILQWGTRLPSGGDGAKVVTLPIAFPSVCSMTLTTFRYSNYGADKVSPGSYPLNNAQIVVTQDYNMAAQWIAIGY